MPSETGTENSGKSLPAAAPAGRFCSLHGNSKAAWGICLSLFLVPILPDFIAPLCFFLPLLCALATHDGRNRLRALFLGRRWLVILFLTFVGAGLVGIFWATSLSSALLTCLLWAVCFSAFLGTAASIRGENELHLALTGFYGGVLVNTLLAVLQAIHFATGMPFWNPFWVPLEQAVIKAIPFIEVNLDFVAERSTAAFTNSGVFGFYLVMAIPLCFYLLARATGWKKRLLSAIPMLCTVISLAVTYSRMSYITFFIVLFYLLVGYSLVHFRRIRTSRRILLGVGLTLAIPLLAVLFALLLPDAVTDRFFSVFRSDNSINTRIALWRTSLWVWMKDPWRLLTGYGTGVQNTWELFRANAWLKTQGITNEPHAHNVLIQLLLEGGVLLLGSFLGLMGSCFTRCFQAVKGQTDKGKYFLISMSGFFFALLLNGMTDYVFIDPKICFLFAVGVGFLPTLPTIVFPERKPEDNRKKIGEQPEKSRKKNPRPVGARTR